MQVITSLLAVLALSGTVFLLVSRVLAARWPVADRFVGAVHDSSLWLAWLVTATATLGSLWFSEVADYVPCRLCWFQRVCMYPLAGILLIAAWRRDRSVRWYALPLLVAGIGVSSYHSLIEWKPWLDSGACGVGPSCTDVWFRRFGFLTLAVMAAIAFSTVLALLFVTPRPGKSDDEQGDRSVGMVVEERESSGKVGA